MADTDVIIVGGGMAGLTCGCLLARRGLNVLMVEKNEKVGGCCTSFERDGFAFDLSVQSLGECQEGGRIWNLLKQLGLLSQLRFIPLEPAREYYFPDQKVIQSSSLENHIENLSFLFPDERTAIETVYGILKGVFEEFIRIPSSVDWFDQASFSSHYPLLFEYRDKTFGELLEKWISHPFLKTLLSIRSSYALLPPHEISVAGMAGIEMSYFSHGVSCIDGKVEKLPFKLAEAFQKLGGNLCTSKEVRQFLMEKKRVAGIRLKSGEEVTAKTVVSNIDARSTFLDLIGEDHLPAGFLSKLKGMRPSLSYFILYLGIDGELDELPVSNNEVFFTDDLQKEYNALYRNKVPEDAPFYLLAPSKVNPSHAPEGKNTLCLSLKVPYQLSLEWDRNVKNQLSEQLIERAATFVPDLKKRILVRVESTPKTIEMQTGNHRGAAYGWAQVPGQSGIHRLQRTTPIPNLYLTGHWTSPGGGISGVVASGELTAMAILSRFEKGEN